MALLDYSPKLTWKSLIWKTVIAFQVELLFPYKEEEDHDYDDEGITGLIL